jgi:hypothetical protein
MLQLYFPGFKPIPSSNSRFADANVGRRRIYLARSYTLDTSGADSVDLAIEAAGVVSVSIGFTLA